MPVMALAAVALVLSIVGFLDSVYFTLMYYGLVKQDLRLIPQVAEPEESVCRTILSTKTAQVFGLPNSVLGLAFYALVAAAATARIITGVWYFHPFIVAIAIIAALFSIYLAWSLVFRMHVMCPLCFLAQAINVALAVMLVIAG